LGHSIFTIKGIKISLRVRLFNSISAFICTKESPKYHKLYFSAFVTIILVNVPIPILPYEALMENILLYGI